MTPWTGRAGHRRHGDRRRRRQDGPAPRRPVRLPRLAGDRGRRERGGRRGDQRRAGPTSPRSRASPSASRRRTPAGRLRATTDGGAAARESDVVVLIVPVMLDDRQQPDYRYMDAAVAVDRARASRAGTIVVFETTLPVGDTRGRYLPMLEAATGLVAERDLFVAFSPERLFSGAVFRNLATYPKLVGGIGPASTDLAQPVLRLGPRRRGRRDELRRGRRAEQARRDHVPRRQHRVRQRAGRVRRRASAWTSSR